MPIAARWRRLSGLPPRRGRDPMPGVYEIADEDKRTIYIGQSARDVPNRIRQHLQKESCIRDRGAFWRYEHSRIPKSHEADHIAKYRSVHGDALPPCNTAVPRLRSAVKRWAERAGTDDGSPTGD